MVRMRMLCFVPRFLQLRELGDGVRVSLYAGSEVQCAAVADPFLQLLPATRLLQKTELAACKTLESTAPKPTRARDPHTASPDKNDPHKLRRLRRPTGPRRAALR